VSEKVFSQEQYERLRPFPEIDLVCGCRWLCREAAGRRRVITAAALFPSGALARVTAETAAG
jgi:hypothetical protein